jgi:hypothetical protein
MRMVHAVAWVAVAVGVTSPELPVPPSSGHAALVLGALAATVVLVKACSSLS